MLPELLQFDGEVPMWKDGELIESIGVSGWGGWKKRPLYCPEGSREFRIKRIDNWYIF